jgi:hypothetical protein
VKIDYSAFFNFFKSKLWIDDNRLDLSGVVGGNFPDDKGRGGGGGTGEDGNIGGGGGGGGGGIGLVLDVIGGGGGGGGDDGMLVVCVCEGTLPLFGFGDLLRELIETIKKKRKLIRFKIKKKYQ